MNENNYSYEILPGNSSFAVIKLGTHALGGSDALKFTSLLNELNNAGVKFCIADLSEIQVINSTGLGMLVSGLSTLKKYNIEFILAGIPKKVQDLLKMTRLDTIFRISPSVESALNN